MVLAAGRRGLGGDRDRHGAGGGDAGLGISWSTPQAWRFELGSEATDEGIGIDVQLAETQLLDGAMVDGSIKVSEKAWLIVLFEEALAELSGMPVERVSNLLYDAGNAGLRALFDQASLPSSTYPAFKEAIEALREGGFMIEPGGVARLKRRMIERVLTRCENEDIGDLAPLLTLLRRFATEAAREEARLFCNELVTEDYLEDEQSEAA